MLKAVIFAMDGLMFDTEGAYAHVHDTMARKRGRRFTNRFKPRLMGKRGGEMIEFLKLRKLFRKKESLDALVAEQDAQLAALCHTSVGKLDGLEELLQFLNAHGIRKCIGTSSRREVVDILLKKHGLTDEFEFIISGDMVPQGKPNPEIYCQCVARLGLLPRECLVLEDSLNGVKSGIGAGCYTCAIPSVYARAEDFSLSHLVCPRLDDPKLKNFVLHDAPMLQ